MALNLGDAFLTFRGDLTQLNLAFQDIEGAAQEKLAPAQAQVDALGAGLDRVATEAEQAAAALASAGAAGSEAGSKLQSSWQAVAKATVENYQAQKELSAALYAVKSTGGDSAEAMSRLAAAQERAATSSFALKAARDAATADFNKTAAAEEKIGSEATATEALLSEAFGVKIPRHIRGFVAELPGVGMALNAAFSAVAVLMLIQIGAEALEKFKEWRQEAELQRQNWIRLQGTFHDTTESINQDIEQQEQKFIGLTEGPVAALDYAFQHLHSTADATLKKIVSELDQVSENLKKQDHVWNFSVAGPGAASEDLKRFAADLQDAMQKASAASPKDPTAAFRAGIKLSEDEVKKLSDKIVDLENTTVDLGEGVTTNANINVEALKKTRDALVVVLDQLKKGQEDDAARKKAAQQEEATAAAQRAQELGDARINAAKFTSEKLLALQDDETKRAYEHGQISFAQEIQALKDHANKKYEVDKSALEQSLALARKDPTKNAASIITLNGQLRDLEIDHQRALEQIDDQANRKRAADYLAGLETQIAGAKQGSQERINLEEQVAAFLKRTYGEESTQYQQQLQKVAAARRAHAEEIKKIAQAEAQGEEVLSRDKAQAAVAYYQYLVSTARASLAQVARIQREAEEQDFALRRAALERQLKQLDPQEIAARKQVLGQIALLDQQLNEKRQLWGLQTTDVLELYYRQLGLSSAESYKRQAEIAHDAYAHILLSGKATYGELLQAQMALLKAEIAEKQASGQNVTRDIANLRKLEAEYARLKLRLSQASAGQAVMNTLFKALGLDADLLDLKLGKLGDTTLLVAGAAQTMALAWAQGGVTIAQAAEQMAEAVLQSLAKIAFAKGTEQLALGFAALSPMDPDFGHSGEHFASAAEWFAAGALASVVSGVIANASHGSTGSSASADSGVSVAPADATPATNPTPVTNVQRFATGGLVSSPTLAVIGDSITSASRAASEAILPLEDPRAMSRIAGAITSQMPQSNAGGHIHITLESDVVQTIRKINHAVKNNGVPLTASTALKVTKKA